jgi:hypothetical protein
MVKTIPLALALAAISGLSSGLISSSADAQLNVPLGPSGGPPALQAKAKVFSVAPKDQGQDFMCEAGFVHSVLATAGPDNGIVPIELLDAAKKKITKGDWTSASGFKFAKSTDVDVNVIFICGN